MEHPDAWAVFLNNLPATLTAFAALVASIGAIVASLRNTQKIDENTVLTSAVKEDVKKIKTEAVEGAKEVAATAAAVAQKTEAASTKTADAVAEVAKAVNGRMDERIEDARKAAYAEGMLQGSKLATEHAAQLQANTLRIEALNEHTKRNAEHLRVIQESLAVLIANKGSK